MYRSAEPRDSPEQAVGSFYETPSTEHCLRTAIDDALRRQATLQRLDGQDFGLHRHLR